MGSIPGSGRSSGEGNPLQYSCFENSMARGTWPATTPLIIENRLVVTNGERGKRGVGD